MDIIRVTPKEYERLIPDRRVFFNEPRFTELNRDKVDDIHYLIIAKGNSPRFGAIVGQKETFGKMPFSAPYSYPVPVKAQTGISSYDEALSLLEEYCGRAGMNAIRFVFPPFFYDENILSAWTSSLYRSGYRAENIDINYSLDLDELNTPDYEKLLSANARNHLNKAIKSGMEIVPCKTIEEKRTAYKIIEENHTAKNRPTRMSFDQVMATCELVNHEFFLAKINETPIASMIYYEITREIVQCIYSGYLLEYSNSGVMNYLTAYTIRFFGNKGYKKIDRAISTEDSTPNYGLCDFKESVGGKRSLKYTFQKVIR